jgi:hypothetical protein
MLRNCREESGASSSFVRDLTDLGAEYYGSDWEIYWTGWFNISVYRYGRDIAESPLCLPRVMVESMKTVPAFAEGELYQPTTSLDMILTS